VNKAPFKVKLYFFFSLLLDPIYFFYQKIAVLRKKEDSARFAERWVDKSIVRPAGSLIWLHVASVGEALSVLPLIEKILEDIPQSNVLVTSTTKTSAEMLKEYTNDRFIHQMSPYDTFFVSKRFLNHWKPDLACRVESEIWPRILFELKKRQIPNYLLNARFSSNSVSRMKKNLISSKYLLSLFDQIHVPERSTEKFLLDIGLKSKNILITGFLKDSRSGLRCDEAELEEFKQVISRRNVWLAASTHKGEDEFILEAHKQLGGLLIIVPRHIERASEIARLASSIGFVCQIRSETPNLKEETEVYVADTMGEMGIWYSLVQIAFIGGSLVERGGHNPLEAAQLGVVSFHGPHIYNTSAKYRQLQTEGVSYEVNNAEDIVERFNSLSFKELKDKAQKAKNISQVDMTAVDESVKVIKKAITI
jgi:3-deoxy-D-manno-octulosonic-acid transferase